MNLKEQRYVCMLAKTGSLSVASSRLFISQPALSLYIKGLEESLGYKLFERIGKRFVLTRAGELYVEKARLMLDLKQSFDLEMASISKGYRERLRIGFQDIRSTDIAPPLIHEFYRRFPNIDLIWYEETYSQMEERLNSNQIDMFFGNCPYIKREFEYIPIHSDRLLLITPANLPVLRDFTDGKQQVPWIDIKIFKDERFILQAEGQSLRTYSDQILKETNLHPKDIFVLKKIQTMMNLVNLDFGVGFCPQSYLYHMKNRNNIRAFHVGSTPKTIAFSAVYQRGKQLGDGAKMLIDMCKDIMG